MAPKADGTTKSVNALMDLLSAAGLDTVDNTTLHREASRCGLELRNSLDGLPEDPQAWDRQVEKLINQLKDALRDAPEKDVHNPLYEAEPVPDPEPEDDYVPSNGHGEDKGDVDDRRQQMERQYSTTSYPKIGPGYSDEISVVSELTIPTVVPDFNVPDEERYGGEGPSAGPPIQMVGLQIGVKPRRTRNHLGRNRDQPKNPHIEGINNKSTPAPTNTGKESSTARPGYGRAGGAAAGRRQAYEMQMERLQQTGGTGAASNRPSLSNPSSDNIHKPMTVSDFPSLQDSSKKKDEGRGGRSRRPTRSKYDASAAATRQASQRHILAKQTIRKTRSNMGGESTPSLSLEDVKTDAFDDFDKPDDDGKNKSGDPVLIDEDGFIIGENATDPFNSSFNPNFPSEDVNPVPYNTATTAAAAAEGGGGGGGGGGFLRASAKDTKRKKGNRRASTGMGERGGSGRVKNQFF